MNIDTGEIRLLTDWDKQLLSRLVPVEAELMTELQRAERRVSLHDHRSALGRQLTEARREISRSKYEPHIGEKQLAREAAAPPLATAA